MSIECRCCGRPLDDPWSARAGIGPICQRIEIAEALLRNFPQNNKPKANYIIVDQDDKHILLKDVGPWDKFTTVTNAAEAVVEEMLPSLGNRKLLYIDSEGDKGELAIVNKKFTGFIHYQD